MTGSYPALDAALVDFGEWIDHARQNLYYCDIGFLRKGRQELRHDIHASTYVLVAAGLETYVESVMNAIIDEINASGLVLRDLRLSIFAVVHSSRLEALQSIRGLKMWDQRADVFRTIESTASCTLSARQLPTRGGTIRPSHLNTTWRVFGLAGDFLPTPGHSLALKDLADSRNAVAHGDEKPAEVAGRKSISDTLRLFDRVEESVLHLYYASVDYLDHRAYLR